MWASTRPALAFGEPNRRPSRRTPSGVVKDTSREASSARLRCSACWLQPAARMAIASATTAARLVDGVTGSNPGLRAQLHPLVPGALEELLVLLLAHLLPALLDQRGHARPFTRFRRGSGGPRASRGRCPPGGRSPV